MATRQAIIEIVLEASKANRAIKSMQTNIGALAKTAAIASGALAVLTGAGLIGDFEKLGAKVENVSNAFYALGRPGLLDEIRKATMGMVDDISLMQQAVKFANFRLPINQMAEMLKFAQVRAAQTGESIDYMVESIVIGLGRESIKVLDNLQLNVGKFRDLVANGATYVEAMTQLMREDMALAGQIAASGFDQMTAAWTNFVNALSSSGGALTIVFETLAKIFNLAADGAKDVATEVGRMGGGKTVEKILKLFDEGLIDEASALHEFRSAIRKAEADLRDWEEALQDSIEANGVGGKYQEDANYAIRRASAYLLTLTAAQNQFKASLDQSVGSVVDVAEAVGKYEDRIRSLQDSIKANIAEDTNKLIMGGKREMENIDWESADPIAEIERESEETGPFTDKYIKQIERIQMGMSYLANATSNFSDALAQSIIYGQSFGEAMVNALKAMVAQLISAVAQALILAAILTAFPAVAAAMGVVGTFKDVFTTVLRGSDLLMSGRRETARYSRTGG